MCPHRFLCFYISKSVIFSLFSLYIKKCYFFLYIYMFLSIYRNKYTLFLLFFAPKIAIILIYFSIFLYILFYFYIYGFFLCANFFHVIFYYISFCAILYIAIYIHYSIHIYSLSFVSFAPVDSYIVHYTLRNIYITY